MTTYQIRKNDIVLGKHKQAGQTLLVGLTSSIALYFVLVYLPDDFPNTVIPLLYAGIGMGIAESRHLKKSDIAESDTYAFESNWRVIGLALLCAFLWFIGAFLLVLPLVYLGLITL